MGPVDPDAAVNREYDVVVIREARLKEYGPNVNAADPSAKILDIGGIKPRLRATWVEGLDALLDAEALDGALEAAAPLIVAAYLEQMRDSAPDPACTSWLNRHIAFLNGDAEQP